MNRWSWFAACAILGLVILAGGLLVPAHLRALDVEVLKAAGKGTPSLVDQGLTLVREQQLGAAQLVLRAAQREGIPGREPLVVAVTNLSAAHPNWDIWGGGDYHLQVLFATDPGLPKSGSEPFTEWVVRLENRSTVLEMLRTSTRPTVRELLRCRGLTNTVIFSPSESSSGQALDAALSVCGLLLEERRLAAGLTNAVLAAATAANRGASTLPLEQILLDLMSLGQRFNWGQLAALVNRIEDPETLRLLANFARDADRQLPELFSAVQLSGKPAQVTKYLADFSQTGLEDLSSSLRYGSGAVRELASRGQRLYLPPVRQRIAQRIPVGGLIAAAASYCLVMPTFALVMRWTMLLVGGFLLALAVHFARRAPSAIELPLQVRGFHLAREVLFALGLLLLVLLLSEPFLSEGSQRVEFPIRLHLPTLEGVIPAGANNVKVSFMNEKSLMTLVLFFVLQGLLYVASLLKLAEIRRQRVPARIKLRLLDNEDHLFDAGLYLGFVGTIISLILFSLGVIKPSLMAAYSSTSFGIIFVSVFKIFNLRPTRRKLVMETETGTPEPSAPPTGRPLATLS